MNILPLLLAVAAPAPEAYELGRQIAGTGLLATLGPLQAKAEVEELIRSHPELSAEEQATLRKIGDAESQRMGEKIADAQAKAYAEALSIEDLRAIAAWQSSPAAEAQRKALPAIIGSTMTSLGDVDFKGSVRAAMCAASGKLCPE